jgi:hypothetical protein
MSIESLSTWIKGKILLVGDSAHPVTPPKTAPLIAGCLRGGTFDCQLPSPVGSEYEDLAIDLY